MVFLIYRSVKHGGVVKKIAHKFFALPIPRGAKICILVVFIGNCIAIALARPLYPFYDVGMFRIGTTLSNKEKIMYVPKYWYYKNGQVKILDLRKEGVFFMAEHFGWGYTHEFTFAVTYHNKDQKENFEFIAAKMKERGVDTLWVGVHTVNYATGEVQFNPDPCQAIQINDTKTLYYGPIYIPDYQRVKCYEQ
ncbi:MAG TPA: hypothetical protein PKC39_01695 [Ferruginibacter sp.]|nr:hypothetical protein [Ferruginibacter sp.]HMP19648.1 hypothetical protein [Ferruginibacter sp.]